MPIFIIKHTAISMFLMLAISGCMRVDIDPQSSFHCVQEEIAQLEGQDIYWEASVVNIVEDLLKHELTEEIAVKIALLNNKNLQGIYENLGIAQAQLAQAGLFKNPIFSLSYRFSSQPSITNLIDMGLFQNFLEILLIPQKKRRAQAELEATKAVVTAHILDVIADTKIAFHRVYALEHIGVLKKQILLAAELSYEAAQRLGEAGNFTDLQVALDRSYYEEAKLAVASWEIALLEAREKLNVLMGLWDYHINWKIAPVVSLIPEDEEDLDNIENNAIMNSIDLRSSFNKLLSAVAQFGVDTTKLVFPQLDVGLSGERSESVWFLGPAINLGVPLFDIGKVNSAKAKAKIMQEWNQYTALAVKIRSNARLARFSLLNACRQRRYLEKVVVPLAEQITHATLLQNHAMQLGVFELLSAKRLELEKKIQLIQLGQEYWTAKITLQTLLHGHILKEPLNSGIMRDIR